MFNSFMAWLDGLVEDSFPDPPAYLDEDSGLLLVDIQCGDIVFNDVPAKMRTELWLSQLQREGSVGAKAAVQFTSLVAQPLPQGLLAEIAKDTHRTFPGHITLGTRAAQRSMLRVLHAYCAFDPEVGYTQGMNFLAGLLLAYLPEASAFGALVLIMQERGLRELYSPTDGMALLQVRLWQLGRLLPPALAAHLEAHQALPVLYASSWFLTCFAADFPLPFSARVMDLVITDYYAAPMMKVAVHVVERCQEQLMAVGDLEEMVNILKQQVPKWSGAKLQDLLTEGLGRAWTPRQTAVLDEINGAETVIEAVARVDAAAAAAAAGTPQQPHAASGGSSAGEGGASGTRPSSSKEGGGEQPQSGGASPAKLLPLPPPPGGRHKRVEWQKCAPRTPALASVSKESVRIQNELKPVQLDSQLSAALSSYSSHAAAPPAQRQQRGGVMRSDWGLVGSTQGNGQSGEQGAVSPVLQLRSSQQEPPPASPFSAALLPGPAELPSSAGAWVADFGAMGRDADAPAQLAQQGQHAFSSAASSLSLRDWSLAVEAGGAQQAEQVTPRQEGPACKDPFFHASNSAEFGRWTNSDARSGGGEAPLSMEQPGPRLHGSAPAPQALQVADALPTSPATMRALALQQAHLQEFSSATKQSAA